MNVSISKKKVVLGPDLLPLLSPDQKRNFDAMPKGVASSALPDDLKELLVKELGPISDKEEDFLCRFRTGVLLAKENTPMRVNVQSMFTVTRYLNVVSHYMGENLYIGGNKSKKHTRMRIVLKTECDLMTRVEVRDLRESSGEYDATIGNNKRKLTFQELESHNEMLFRACTANDIEMVNSLLLNYGANPNVVVNNLLPLEIAINNQNIDMRDLLVYYGANIDVAVCHISKKTDDPLCPTYCTSLRLLRSLPITAIAVASPEYGFIAEKNCHRGLSIPASALLADDDFLDSDFILDEVPAFDQSDEFNRRANIVFNNTIQNPNEEDSYPHSALTSVGIAGGAAMGAAVFVPHAVITATAVGASSTIATAATAATAAMTTVVTAGAAAAASATSAATAASAAVTTVLTSSGTALNFVGASSALSSGATSALPLAMKGIALLKASAISGASMGVALGGSATICAGATMTTVAAGSAVAAGATMTTVAAGSAVAAGATMTTVAAGSAVAAGATMTTVAAGAATSGTAAAATLSTGAVVAAGVTDVVASVTLGSFLVPAAGIVACAAVGGAVGFAVYSVWKKGTQRRK